MATSYMPCVTLTCERRARLPCPCRAGSSMRDACVHTRPCARERGTGRITWASLSRPRWDAAPAAAAPLRLAEAQTYPFASLKGPAGRARSKTDSWSGARSFARKLAWGLHQLRRRLLAIVAQATAAALSGGMTACYVMNLAHLAILLQTADRRAELVTRAAGRRPIRPSFDLVGRGAC